jgi:hypothetical protein
MGIAVVLFVIFGSLLVGAAIFGLILFAATSFYLRTQAGKRWRTAGMGALLPFGCVLYAGVWFLGYMTLNDKVFHHDPIIGDGWYTNIGHGYAVDMIDVTDQGTVHPTDGPSNGLNNPDGLHGVRRLQVAGKWIFGSQDTNWFQALGSAIQAEDKFFAINTSDRSHKIFDTQGDLANYARSKGVDLRLQPILDVYREQRSDWFDIVAGLVLLAGPALMLWRYIRHVWRIGRRVDWYGESASVG